METLELAPNEKRCSRCKEVKDRGEFNKDRNAKDGLQKYCRICSRFSSRQSYCLKNNLLGDGNLICPICNCTDIKNLSLHALKAHNWKRDELELLGVDKFVSNETSSRMSKAHQKKSLPTLRRGEVVEIRKNIISFPRDYWPAICKYAGVMVSKIEKRVYLKPYSRKHFFTKVLKQHGQRLILHVPDKILGSLITERDFELIDKSEKKGFFIKFPDKNDPLLDLFAIWASNHAMKNTSLLAVHQNKAKSYVSIAKAVWPVDCEHAYLEYNSVKKGNRNGYLDVLPISGEKLNVRGSLDYKPLYRKGVYRVVLSHSRYEIVCTSFISTKNMPLGYYDLVKNLPSGALRFRFYKERQQSEEIES